MDSTEPIPPPEAPHEVPESAGPRFLHSIHLVNLLSFGQESPAFPLRNLNVLVGPNGSGKSNLLDAVDVLRRTPRDLPGALRGGAPNWIWKGAPDRSAMLRVTAQSRDGYGLLTHSLEFAWEGQDFRKRGEFVRDKSADSEPPGLRWFTQRVGEPPVVRRRLPSGKIVGRRLDRNGIGFDRDRSVLSQVRSAAVFPEITHLAESYERIRLYREWTFGRNAPIRQPQKTDLRGDRLEEDFSNLAMVLNRLRQHPPTKRLLIERLRDLYDGLKEFEIAVVDGTMQIQFIEGDFSIPASRLSDGSLRYLCLLAILCDPNPPPLICLEEPELGLHPDLVSKVADLLIDASERCQLIVTTHSDIIVDALTERPEDVVVCEKSEGATTMRRMDAAALKPWLEQYRLGELWSRGEIGGNRW